MHATKHLFTISYFYFFIYLFSIATIHHRVSYISLLLEVVCRKFKLIKEIVNDDEDFCMHGYQ